MLMYIGIFLSKMVEVALSTVRHVLVQRGEKVKGAVIGFFECLLWVIVVSNVIATITKDPIRVVVYCLGFAAGNYVGVIIEEKLAIGTVSIQAIVQEEEREALSETLRDQGFGVTNTDGYGKDGPVGVMTIFLKRRCINEASRIIKEQCPDALITVNDVRHMRAGFIKK